MGFILKLSTRPGKKILLEKQKANKMRIISKQLLGLCGFIPMSKFSFLKMNPHTKHKRFANFVKFCKI